MESISLNSLISDYIAEPSEDYSETSYTHRGESYDYMQVETKAAELSSEEKILNMLEKTGWKAGKGKYKWLISMNY